MPRKKIGLLTRLHRGDAGYKKLDNKLTEAKAGLDRTLPLLVECAYELKQQTEKEFPKVTVFETEILLVENLMITTRALVAAKNELDKILLPENK